MFVYTMQPVVQLVAQPVSQPVVSYKWGISSERSLLRFMQNAKPVVKVTGITVQVQR